MTIYFNTYHNLCEYGKSQKQHYAKFSGLHKHHIIPVHSGGTDDDSNLTYLTMREHAVAHFMLWKMNKNPQDIGALKMLGGNLTPHRRKIMGEWCRDNKIGFHSDLYTKEQRAEWRMRGTTTSMKNQTGFFDPERRTEWAVMGGLVGGKKQVMEQVGIHVIENRKEYATMGGKACGKIPMWCNGYINKRSYDSPGPEWFCGMIQRVKGTDNIAVYNYEYINRQPKQQKNLAPMWTNGTINRRCHYSPGPEWFRGMIQRVKGTDKKVVRYYK